MPHPQRLRVIIDTDAKNEADDQFAIVHALLSPTLDVSLIAAHFGTRRSQRSMEESRAEIDLLVRLLDMSSDVSVANGAPAALPDERTPVDSAGARMIIEQSRSATAEDPLYVAFLGPLTDMASAILLDPQIVRRDLIVIWIGGHRHDALEPLGIEFNLSNDVAAANVVFDSGIQVWQVPSSVYRMVAVSYAELDQKVASCGAIGAYLVRQLKEWNERYVARPIEHRSLGDSPAISLVLNPHGATYRTVPAPRFGQEGYYVPGSGHPLRVIETVDVRFLLEDMFAKLRHHAATAH